MIHEWLGIPAAFIAWGFALYVYLVAPPSRGARYLIAMLAVDGLAVFTSHSNHLYFNAFFDSIGFPQWEPVTHQVSDWAMIAVYLPFIGMTLTSPLVAPLKNRAVANTILYGGLAIALSLFFMPESVRMAFNFPFYVVIVVVLAWGFAAAVHSWYIASTDIERDRARAFTIAFGVRDVLWTLTFTVWVLYHYEIPGQGLEIFDDPDNPLSYWTPFLYQVAVIIYVPLVAYGVLRVQLFDIDLRIKRSLKRGATAGAFVATFFVISELASNYLSDQFGAFLGVLASGVLVFFLDPIQKAAERFSNAAMPNTSDTPEYLSFRKLQVYDAALRSALEDGSISKRQRRVLDSMIESMQIDRAVAQQLESDMLQAMPQAG